MTKMKPQEGKKNFTFHIGIQCIIWTLAICMMAFIFYKKITPVYTQEYLNSVLPFNTPELNPGDSVSQSFRSSLDHLYSVGVAISYHDDLPEDASVLIQVLAGDELIVEQSLGIRYCPNSSFCTLVTDLQDCQDKTITIHVENTSPSTENAVFSLLATDKNFLYLDSTDNYLLNGKEQNARLLFASSYITGYSFYRALTYSFWVLLAALIASGLVSKQPSALRERFSS